MEFAGTGPPSEWIVTLQSDEEVRIWADHYSQEADHIDFGLLVDADQDDQAELDITSRTPSDRRRVVMTIARFPTSAVRDVFSA